MANYSDVNFIKHLLSISEKFIEDDRLSPLHISLYYALFQSWNLSKFRVPISISRNEIMRASKIGSANTYTKCLKELDEWAYIKYEPSHNPYKGSQIHMYNFNKTTNNGSHISSDKGTNKTIEKTNAKSSVKAAIPSINTLNNTNKLNSKNEYGHTRKKNSSKSSMAVAKQSVEGRTERKKVAPKKEMLGKLSGRAESRPKRPLLQAVQKYFNTNQWPAVEAEKFFNYYQSNGWLVGGKTPMHSWQACASNWILNVQNFTNGKEKPQAGKLNATTGKNYSESF